MPTRDNFSILLVTDNPEQASALEKLIKPAFPRFYIAHTEAEALGLIVAEQITILLMGLSTIGENESCFLHLISNKDAGVGGIVKRKFLLCGKDEIRDAFSICNKDIFDDYFITRPLYDPYHILIRLRFLMRLFRKEAQQQAAQPPTNGEELAAYLDKIIHCEQSIEQTKAQQLEQLVTSVSTVLDLLKQGVAEGSMNDSLRNTLMALIQEKAEKNLEAEVEYQQQKHHEVSYQLKSVADIARVKKEMLEGSTPIDLQGVDVLLVEDESQISQSLSAALSLKGSDVAVAATATEAVKLVSERTFQVILLDLTLPDMAPFFVINKVKATAPGARIILLARAVDRNNVEECLKAGASGVLIKPIDHQVLIHKVAKSLSAEPTG